MKIHKQLIKDFLVSFSYVNLCFVRIWYPLIMPQSTFYQGRVPNYSDFTATVTNIIIFSLIGTYLIQKVRIKGNNFVIASLLALLAFSFHVFTQLKLPPLVEYQHYIFIFCCLLVISSFLSRFFHKVITKAIYFFLLFFSLHGIYYFIVAPYRIYSLNQDLPIKQALVQRPQHTPSKQRVIWIIYDELDQGYVFDESKNNTLKLHNLLELYEKSFHASEAHAPTDRTVNSIFSYLIGLQVESVKPLSSTEAIIITPDTEEKLKPQETIFYDLYQQGYNIGIAGWHIPYCFIFEKYTSTCNQFGSSKYNYSSSQNFFTTVVTQLRSLLPNWASYQHKMLYEKFWSSTKNLIINKNLDLVYLHFPIPHFPKIYDTNKMKLYSALSDKEGYPANLTLVNESIREMTDILKKYNLYDESIILVTSDHWRRTPESYKERHYRVPFFIKLRTNFQKPYEFKTKFSSILVHSIVPKLLNGELSTVEDISNFINKNSQKYPIAPILSE